MFEIFGDRYFLVFLSTVASRGQAEHELLRSDDDLAAWVVAAGIVDDLPRPASGDLARTTALREAMYRMMGALIDDRAPDPADRAALNVAARTPLPVLRLDAGGVCRDGDLGAVLSFLARDCIDLHDSPDRELLRRCSDERCSRLFVDRSRGRRRRWCGMKGCGDRAEAAAYRERARGR